MDMKTIDQIRADNTRTLRDAIGGNTAFSARINREPTQVSRLIGINPTKRIGNTIARHIEECFDLVTGWLDQEHPEKIQSNDEYITPLNHLKIRHVPLLTRQQAATASTTKSTAAHNNHGEYYACPVPCGKNTFALAVTGDAMAPDYTSGEIAFIDPNISPSEGDTVLACSAGNGEIIFRQFMNDGYTAILKSVNPDWPNQYIEITDNIELMGTVIISFKIRKK
ncbi:S24 family peptidase [Morganella psychrotolerans]|uniref:LexA family transcriptional repressor n=1 Tax=Morganella psychrotolerans TaxID=368603 RepID=A0A5M9R809_9GAMM|nr:S24 family peptidase [Morganella psychrotolerans]KAA8716683.1 LexA family transcriptional repressor [Morganella psychrotolerans]